MQARCRNNNANALTALPAVEKFSTADSGKNIIRSVLMLIGAVRHQYTSCWNRPFFLSSPTKLTASSVDRAPN